MMSESSNKILLITNIPTPYRIPLFNELSNQLVERGLKLKVIFGALAYPRRKWISDLSGCCFDYKVLHSRIISLPDGEKAIFDYRDLFKIIKKERPRAIVANGFSLATTKLWIMSWFRSIRYIIWSGAISLDSSGDSLLRKMQRKLLISRASGYIAYGRKAKEYLISVGANPGKIEIGINTVDTDFFISHIKKVHDKSNKIDRKKILLYVGHLVKRKGLHLLFCSISLLRKKRNDFLLKIVGDGPEKERLVDLAEELDIKDVIRFEGFKQKRALLTYYSEAGCFLFPTTLDIWGLVLVEAMAAGLPCIASIHAGATYDLVEDGKTGFKVDFYDFENVAKKIEWILDNAELAKSIGRAGSVFINKNANLQKSASGFINMILKVKQ